MEYNIQFNLNSNFYLRDPQETKLGKKIIEHGIICIHELGFEAFTFKKLSDKIESTEASIYRYFENKHKLLLYLSAWYWEWLSFQINFNTQNLNEPKDKLSAILQVISDAGKENHSIGFVNESKLHAIMVAEGVKAFHIKEIDAENKQGLFNNFKDLSQKISLVIQEINPQYPYPNSLATILLETAFNHIYYAEHLPKLTNVQDSKEQNIQLLLNHLCDNLVLKVTK